MINDLTSLRVSADEGHEEIGEDGEEGEEEELLHKTRTVVARELIISRI
jgi:hypothetical protein